MIGGRFRNRAIRIPYYAVPRPCETEIPPDASRLAFSLPYSTKSYDPNGFQLLPAYATHWHTPALSLPAQHYQTIVIFANS